MPLSQQGANSPGRCKVVMMSGSKGGCGKSTVARNILVAAKQAGVDVLGIDFDPQATLFKWAARRERARETLSECVSVEVISGEISSWNQLISNAKNRDLVIIDTAPSVENYLASVLALLKCTDFVMVPTGSTNDDLESVIPWMKTLQDAGVNAEFIMNKVNPRTRSFQTARTRLLKIGKICTVEIPQLEEIHLPNDRGLVPLDFDKGRAVEALDAMWTYVNREISFCAA